MDEFNSILNTSRSLDLLEQVIEYSSLIGGGHLTSVAPIRQRQDERITQRICRRALRVIPDESLITLQGSEFFIGSVDFMVSQSPEGELNYVVLETNGGSNRGYTALGRNELDQVCNGYLEMLDFISDPSPVIIVGHPTKDILLAEKIILAERIRTSIVERGMCQDAKIIRLKDFRGLLNDGEGLVILDSYDVLLPALVGSGERIILNGHPVDAIIGDGVARRHYQMGRGERFEVVLANWCFNVTDDKYSTYRAVEMAADKLAAFNVYPFKAWSADTIDDLIEICQRHQDDMELIIKPFQGSGGAGVHPIDKKTPLRLVVEESMGEYREKFGAWRSPFPYTICEKVNAYRADWRGAEHNYDIRVYVARDGDQLFAVGALFRIALEPHSGGNRKRALVVNLSGYGGLDIERGLGVSSESLKITRLSEEDLANMFAASAVLLTFIAKNHEKIHQNAVKAG